jgi:hypothetical protein
MPLVGERRDGGLSGGGEPLHRRGPDPALRSVRTVRCSPVARRCTDGQAVLGGRERRRFRHRYASPALLVSSVAGPDLTRRGPGATIQSVHTTTVRVWARRLFACAALATVAVTGSAGTASAALPVLDRVYPPNHAYSLLLPSGWRFRDLSYPSDHATNLWWTPTDPLAKANIVLSGCVGCVSTNNYRTPNPAGAVPEAASTNRVSPDEIAFTAPADPGDEGDYVDNGVVIVTADRGQVTGYVRIDLWLPPSQHSLATAILNSLRVRS